MSEKISVPGSTLKVDPKKRLSRKKALMRGSRPKQRKPMRRRQPDRDWDDAILKVAGEPCRLCEDTRIEAAHVVGREHDQPKHEGTKTLWVNPDAVIPLCRAHHDLYDGHQVDVLPVLTLEEQLRAVEDAGGIELARRRTCPTAYRGGP